MENTSSSPIELAFGGLLAVFAALLSLNDLAAGKYGEDEIKLANDKTGAYFWYQSKGIKESLAEGQRNLLQSLLASGAIEASKVQGMRELAGDLDEKIGRYKKEKKEILLGSKAVGPENWAQDVDGEMGKVVGAKEIEQQIERLSAAGDRFDQATLFLQLSLVLGALGLLLKGQRLKVGFLVGMTALGIAGSTISLIAYRMASA